MVGACDWFVAAALLVTTTVVVVATASIALCVERVAAHKYWHDAYAN